MPPVRRISVVVPTHDRPDGLARCLDALARCGRPGTGLEVVVVDDGGARPAAPVVERAADALDVRCVRQERRGPAAARNRGIELASADVVALTDDDCAPEPGWADALADAVEAAGASPVLAGGRCIDVAGTLPSSTSEWLAAYAERRLGFVTSNNLAAPRAALVEAGGFSERFGAPAGEDRELCRRLVREGWSIVDVPEAVVAHAHHLDWRSFVAQHRRFGEAAVLLDDVDGRADRLSLAERGRMLVDALGDGGPRLLGGVVVSQVAVAVGGLAGTWRRRTR